MLIDFKTPILDLKGAPLKSPSGTEFILMEACQEALTATFPDEAQLAGADKVKRFALAMKISSSLPVELAIEDAAEIQKLVAKAYGPLIVGRVFEIFDGKGTNNAKAEARKKAQA